MSSSVGLRLARRLFCRAKNVHDFVNYISAVKGLDWEAVVPGGRRLRQLIEDFMRRLEKSEEDPLETVRRLNFIGQLIEARIALEAHQQPFMIRRLQGDLPWCLMARMNQGTNVVLPQTEHLVELCHKICPGNAVFGDSTSPIMAKLIIESEQELFRWHWPANLVQRAPQ